MGTDTSLSKIGSPKCGRPSRAALYCGSTKAYEQNTLAETPQISGRIRLILPICSADLWGFCDFAASFCRLVGASGILPQDQMLRWSDGQKVRAKPSRPDTLKKAKQPRVLKKVTTAQRLEKYSKYPPPLV